MSVSSMVRSPRAWFLVVLVAAVVWWVAFSYAVGMQLLKASSIETRPNPPGMAAGPDNERPPLILASNAWDGYIWIRHAEDMVEHGTWRLKHTDFDHAPEGRGVHWNSGWAWTLIGLGWIDHCVTGVSLNSGIARMAMWANPIAFLLFLVLIACWTVRRWGAGPAMLVVLAIMALPGYQEGFAAGYPDHHGLHNAAILMCVLGVLLGGLGWTREREAVSAPGWMPDSGTATKDFVLSAVAGACGLWVSALTLTIVLVGMGVGVFVAIAMAGRRVSGGGVACRPELWRLWGWVGGGASLLLYLLEYFPSDVGMRLEVNHPLYALAWAGAGELIFRFQRWRTGAGSRGLWDGVWVGGAICALAMLPLAIKVGGSAWYRPFDPFLFELHKRIAEFLSFAERAPNTPFWATVLYVLGMVVSVGAGLWVVFTRATSVWVRTAALFVSFASVSVIAAYFFQVRWGMAASSACAAAAPVFGLAWREWRGRGLSLGRSVLAGGVCVFFLVFPAVCARDTVASFRVGHAMVDKGRGLSLLFRDIAQFIRASVGPDARVVILSSPNTSNPTSYFGRFHTIGTLYWENRDGLFDAASIFNETDDGLVLKAALERGVTHIVYVSEENFLAPYFELQHPGQGVEGWRATFGYRSFFEGKLPAWTRPLPYVVPDYLKPLNAAVRLLQIEPQQSIPEAYFHVAEFQLVSGAPDGALVSIEACLRDAPGMIVARFKKAEILLHLGRGEEAARELRAIVPMVEASERGRICFEFAGLAARTKNTGLVAELLRESVRARPRDPVATNDLAWLLATSQDDALRSGAEAVELARRLVDSNPNDPIFAGTLGVALAETGDFDGAIRLTQRAIELARASSRTDLVDAAEARLAGFRAGKRWRE